MTIRKHRKEIKPLTLEDCRYVTDNGYPDIQSFAAMEEDIELFLESNNLGIGGPTVMTSLRHVSFYSVELFCFSHCIFLASWLTLLFYAFAENSLLLLKRLLLM